MLDTHETNLPDAVLPDAVWTNRRCRTSFLKSPRACVRASCRLDVYASGDPAPQPRPPPSPGQSEAGVDEHRAAGRHDPGDRLTGESVVLAGVGEPQPRAQAPPGLRSSKVSHLRDRGGGTIDRERAALLRLAAVAGVDRESRRAPRRRRRGAR